MKTIAIASGKGGAGKTSLSAALASLLAPSCVAADCDVDAANTAIALGARLRSREDYVAGPGFIVDASKCLGCGACVPACRFDAIHPSADGQRFEISGDLCERCGACQSRCPARAIVSRDIRAGELFVSDTRLGISLAHAELIPGEDTSGKLVAKVRDRADTLAKDLERSSKTETTIVVDAPPGIGCPVIASLARTDLVLMAVEASATGIRDARRLAELLSEMKRKAIAVVNKAGLAPRMDESALKMLEEFDIPLAGKIPFDPGLRSAEEKGKTWLETDCPAAEEARLALKTVIRTLKSNEIA